MDVKKIFNIEQLRSETEAQEIKNFVMQHKFCVVELDEVVKKNPIIKSMAKKAGFYNGIGGVVSDVDTYHYNYIAIVFNGEGTKLFNSVFHRSISDVDQHMVPHKKIKDVFTEEQVLVFFQELKTEVGEFQIRGMKNARIRSSVIDVKESSN